MNTSAVEVSSDDFEAKLSAADIKLTPAGRRVIAFIRQNRTAVLASSALEIAQKTGTSDATVVRTLQKIGFQGLADLKAALVASLEPDRSPAADLRRSLAELEASNAAAFDDVIRIHTETLDVIRSEAVRSALSSAAVVLNAVSRIVVFGIGPSAALATYTATLLARAGRHTHLLTATGGALADQLLDLREGDALIAMAYGTPYSEILAVLEEARVLQLPRILITERSEGPLVDKSTTVIAIPRGRPGHVALHGGTLVALEALIFSLATLAPDRSLQSLNRLSQLRKSVK